MISLIVLVVAVATVQAQYIPHRGGDPAHVRILKDNRAQSILGDFKVKYAQEDGTNFNEVTSADGNRRGSYSYFDDKGKKHEIQYEAGKGGFRIIGGTHKVGPQRSATKPAVPSWQYPPSHPVWQAPVPKAPRIQAQPQYQKPNAAQPTYVAPRKSVPAAPFSYSVSTGNQQASVSYTPPVVKPQPQVHYQRPPQPQPAQVPFLPNYLPENLTQRPTRFFPPGNLQLQRTQNGYAYSFTS